VRTRSEKKSVKINRKYDYENLHLLRYGRKKTKQANGGNLTSVNLNE